MSATSDLLKNYQHLIGSLTLITGSRGVFDVRVDGEILFSKAQAGRHAEPGEVLSLFEQHYAQGEPRYGQ